MVIRHGPSARALIRSKGFDQTQIAEEVQVSKAFMSMLLSGHRGTSPETAARIVRALGEPESSLDDLFKTQVAVVPASRRRQHRLPVTERRSA